MQRRCRVSQWFFIFVAFFSIDRALGILYPQRNEYRRVDSLDGLWTFVMEPSNSDGIGFREKWADRDLSQFPVSTVVPVPSAFNDLTLEKGVRDHVGWVWYQTKYVIHSELLPKCGDAGGTVVCRSRVASVLHFESVNYYAVVFVNGERRTTHVGGHLPFEVPIKDCDLLNSGVSKPMLITVAVNNTLSSSTIPPGEFRIYRLPTGAEVVQQSPTFDFFNYAGILRSVHVVHQPRSHIVDVQLTAGLLASDLSVGELIYKFSAQLDPIDQSLGSFNFDVTVYEPSGGEPSLKFQGSSGRILLKNVLPWAPRGYGEPNLYAVEIKLLLNSGDAEPQVMDHYIEHVGFRRVSFDNNSVLINGRKFYCTGFGMHEDSEIRGRGFDRVIMIKDLNMFEWMGGNCYRTSHYPYSQERAFEADRRGIAVITEVPAVGMSYFTTKNQELHKTMLTEMISRDRNRASVIMWSVANEPQSTKRDAGPYFKLLIDHVRRLDSSRPVTMVLNTDCWSDKAAEYLDVICLNRYAGWYTQMGYLEEINSTVIEGIFSCKERFTKPIMIAEYGAEAIIGLSEMPGNPFTEQYQWELLEETHKAFDFLIGKGMLAGEMIWNFADFMTDKSVSRVNGNHKGVLTRDRKPKMSAYLLRHRYMGLNGETDKEEATRNDGWSWEKR